MPETKKLCIIELSVSFELNIAKMHQYKVDKYNPLVNDISDKGYEVSLFAIEVGSRGYISSENDKSFKNIHKSMHIKVPYRAFKSQLSKLAIISSFVIFHAKSEPNWEGPPMLK